MVLLKTLLFTLVVPGTATVLVPWLILSRTGGLPIDLDAIGPLGRFAIVPISLGISFYAWCAWEFVTRGHGTPAPIDPPRELVVEGLYRYTRNPMYLSVLCMLLGEALLFRSLALSLYAGALLAVFHLFIVLYEEPALTRSFGEAYARYRRAVPRWVGWPRALEEA